MAFFFSIFLTVMFQARREKVEAMGEVPSDLIMERQDWLNVAMIFIPILVILFLLLGSKDTISGGWWNHLQPIPE